MSPRCSRAVLPTELLGLTGAEIINEVVGKHILVPRPSPLPTPSVKKKEKKKKKLGMRLASM